MTPGKIYGPSKIISFFENAKIRIKTRQTARMIRAAVKSLNYLQERGRKAPKSQVSITVHNV